MYENETRYALIVTQDGSEFAVLLPDVGNETYATKAYVDARFRELAAVNSEMAFSESTSVITHTKHA